MNSSIWDCFEEVIIVLFHPKENGEKFLNQLMKKEINRIGNYKNCISWSDVTSTWTPLDGAHPYLGEIGQNCIAPEIRVEMRCKREQLQDILSYIKSIHPYEEIEIDIIPLLQID